MLYREEPVMRESAESNITSAKPLTCIVVDTIVRGPLTGPETMPEWQNEQGVGATGTLPGVALA
jgi:hypothetical protein